MISNLRLVDQGSAPAVTINPTVRVTPHGRYAPHQPPLGIEGLLGGRLAPFNAMSVSASLLYVDIDMLRRYGLGGLVPSHGRIISGPFAAALLGRFAARIPDHAQTFDVSTIQKKDVDTVVHPALGFVEPTSTDPVRLVATRFAQSDWGDVL